MAYNFPEGAKFQFSTTFASAKSVTAVTNANPAVATATAHGYTTDDEILFSSGWEDANNTIYRANVIDANSFGIKGLDSSSTTYFGAGSGTGTTQKVSAWTDIPQVLTISSSGGDARYTDVQLLSSRYGIKIPTGFNAVTTSLELAHDPANANYQTIIALSRTSTKVAFRVVAGGGTSYGYGYISVSEMPSMASGQVNKVKCDITFIGRFMSY